MDPWPLRDESMLARRPFGTRRRIVLILVLVAGILITAFTGWLTVEWFGSTADEAPIAYVPLFFVSVGTFALAVVWPIALLIRGRSPRS